MLQWGNSFVTYFDRYVKWLTLHNQYYTNHCALLELKATPSPLALHALNSVKNRFPEVLPGDQTQITLYDGSYINADYLDGNYLFGTPFNYIATQSPTPSTITDFWRMIWQYKSPVIVMVTNEMEGGQTKCVRYWPNRGANPLFVGFDVEVHNVWESVKPYGIARKLKMVSRSTGETHFVHHFMYGVWPLGSCPKSAAGLMDIIWAIGELRVDPTAAPLTIHCGGGAGRTMVFIALHIALCKFQLQQNFKLDEDILKTLRRCRTGVLERFDQYEFCFHAVLEGMSRLLSIERAKSTPQQQPQSSYDLKPRSGSVASSTVTDSSQGSFTSAHSIALIRPTPTVPLAHPTPTPEQTNALLDQLQDLQSRNQAARFRGGKGITGYSPARDIMSRRSVEREGSMDSQQPQSAGQKSFVKLINDPPASPYSIPGRPNALPPMSPLSPTRETNTNKPQFSGVGGGGNSEAFELMQLLQKASSPGTPMTTKILSDGGKGSTMGGETPKLQNYDLL